MINFYTKFCLVLLSIFVLLFSLPGNTLPAKASESAMVDLNMSYGNMLEGLNFNVQLDSFERLEYKPAEMPNAWNPLENGLNGAVYTIFMNGLDIYVGGEFTDAGGNVNADYIAKWNGSSWSALGNGTDGPVYTIIGNTYGGLIVGGNFTSVSGVGNTSHIAEWNGSSWSSISNSELNGIVYTIEYHNGNLFVGGGFTDVGGNSGIDYIGILDNAGNWSALSGIPVTGIVYTMKSNDVDLYVGGFFSIAGGVANTAYIAKWDGSAWSALGTGMSGGAVRTLVFNGSTLYAGGDFNQAGGVTNTDKIAQWNGSNWSSVGNGITSGSIYSILIHGSDVFAAGSFESAGGDFSANKLVMLSGSSWAPVGTAPTNTVFSILMDGGKLYAGGHFQNAGGNANADSFAVYEFPGTTFTVTTTSDELNTDGDCSLREAISASNDDVSVDACGTGTGSDVIQFSDSLGVATITLSSSLPTISDPYGLILNGGNDITISGSSLYRILITSPKAHLTIKNISLIHGNGDIYPGGAISNDKGYVYIYNNRITDNSATFGAGIYSTDGILILVNSTIDGNSATNTGGAVYSSNGSAWIINSTISNNSATTSADGIYITSIAFIYNTIIANGPNGDDCVGTVIAKNSLIEGSVPSFTRCGLSNGVDNNIINVDPLLGTLTGSPGYYPLGANSPAVDGGDYQICLGTLNNSVAQNNVNRPQGVTCDMGSFELPQSLQPLPTGWVGAVSVTSDKNLVAVGRPHIGSEIASYSGFASGSLTAFVPMLFKDAFGGSYDAALYIQNVGSVNTANITIEYFDSTGNLNCTKTDTVSPLASKGYWLPTATCDTGSLPAGWVGGVKVTSNEPIVAVGRPHIGSEVLTYNGFAAGSNSAYIPMLFKDAFGGSYDAAFYVQNVGASTAVIHLYYYSQAGTLVCEKQDTIEALASKGYWVPTATCDIGSIPAGWVGGVMVTSDQPMVTVGRPHIGTQITSYDGVSTGNLTSYIPMLFKDAFGGSYDAAYYIQNTTANTATVVLQYFDNTGTLNCTRQENIAPLASIGIWVPSAVCDTGSLPTGWVGGVKVTSDQPIVTVGRPHIGTQVTTYNGFDTGSLTTYLPMLFKDAFGGSYDAAFYLQNTDENAANVTIQFFDSTGTLICSRLDTIQPHATLGFWAPSVNCYP